MKFVLVGNRNGNAVVNWLGVLASALIVAIIAMAGSAAVMLAIGWFSPIALIMAASFVPALVVGMGIKRSLQLPIKELTTLE